MKVEKSSRSKGIIGIMGHAGAGHVHSNFGFVQDDTAGFAVVACLLRRAFPVCTTISSVDADIDTGTVTVRTQDGGKGIARTRRGITPYEATLARLAIGLDAVYSQKAAFAAFGRIYGQGVMELPVALQTATCLAVIDTFEKKYPGKLVTGDEDMPGKIGRTMGAVLEINSIPVSIMALLNANDQGLGPDEDLEGNIMLGDKGRAMKALGLDRLPTIILESKAYVPAMCKDQEDNRFWVRMNKDMDNRAVYNALVKGIHTTGLPCTCSDTAYPRGTNEMATNTRELGERIATLGKDLARAATAREKVAIMGKLAVIVSQDAGGVTFMSSDLHNVVAGGGLMPGTAAVLSMTVSEHSIKIWKIPAFVAQDADKYIAIIKKTLPLLAADIENARQDMEERFSFREDDFNYLFTGK